MKTVSVSSASVSNAMRYSQMHMQMELVEAQKEMTTLKVADTGLALGTRASQSVNFHRDLDRLNTIIDSNGLVALRLGTTQSALDQIGALAQTLMETLTTATTGDLSGAVLSDSGKATLQSLTGLANTALNGEYLFAGTNTDIKPLDDFTAADSPAKAAFDAAFFSHFGFTKDDPAAASITAAQIDDFIITKVEPQFLGAGWGNWSSATDQGIVSRISLNETVETSVSANNEGIRKLAMAAAMATDLFSGNLSDEARKAAATRALSLSGQAISDLSQIRAQTGIVQKSVSDASDRMKTQTDLFKKHLLDLEGVDPYEAATRVNDLMTHIQTSFALTARIQQLSLLNYLT
ncbi:flagellar hook-associated family protein [Manganibacter manganicus]|uniref:Flagellin n=1 Tax=Manganibacter manganicus TaxID=1873176 RepID=A0A1V8RV30_9HYPH|nr:flagellar hook-associated family protein [Pseudaminobacter manganicus]OQM77051.1 flagellar biosynthesis protein FlgL [Pseudaminobacter manganicus]